MKTQKLKSAVALLSLAIMFACTMGCGLMVRGLARNPAKTIRAADAVDTASTGVAVGMAMSEHAQQQEGTHQSW